MGHLGKVSYNRVAGYVDSERHRKERVERSELLAVNDLAEKYRLALPVRDLKADIGGAGDNLQDAHRLREERSREICGDVGDLG